MLAAYDVQGNRLKSGKENDSDTSIINFLVKKIDNLEKDINDLHDEIKRLYKKRN